MRALVVTIWVFINLIFFGMCGYMYLLWSQYWMYIEKQIEPTISTYDQQIYYYNRGQLNGQSNNILNSSYILKTRVKHALSDSNQTFTIIKNSKPRFPNVQGIEFEFDSKKYVCWSNESEIMCLKKTIEFKDKLVTQMRRVLMDESNILKNGNENPYNVQYEGDRGNFLEKNKRELLCEFRKVNINTLKKSDILNTSNMLIKHIPSRGFMENKQFNTCAIVASAGALKNSNLGEIIDLHDLVLRFNNAPTKGFEQDVGSKTTIRIINSQVIAKEQYKFLESDVYRNVTILAWDPSNYRASVDEWIEKPEFDFFPNYLKYRKNFLRTRFFIINPQSLWKLWDFLQNNSQNRLRRNPPSSGFLGLALMLPYCNVIDMFEYVPSVRVSKRCHYYDSEQNSACTFGVWHPLAAEKLLSYHLNVADVLTVFQKGFIRITTFRNSKC